MPKLVNLYGVKYLIEGDVGSPECRRLMQEAFVDLTHLKENNVLELDHLRLEKPGKYLIDSQFGQDIVYMTIPFVEKRGRIELRTEVEKVKDTQEIDYIFALEAWDLVEDKQIGYVLCPDGFGGPRYELLVTDNVVLPIPDDFRNEMGFPRYYFDPGEWAAWYAAKQAENPKLTVYPFCYPDWKKLCNHWVPETVFNGAYSGQMVYEGPHPLTWRPYLEEDVATGTLPEKLVHLKYEGDAEIKYLDISNPLEICEAGHTAYCGTSKQAAACCLNKSDVIICLEVPSLFGVGAEWYEPGYEGHCNSACQLIRLEETYSKFSEDYVYWLNSHWSGSCGLGKDDSLYALAVVYEPSSEFKYAYEGLDINGFFVTAFNDPSLFYQWLRWFKTGENSYIVVACYTKGDWMYPDLIGLQVFDVIDGIPTLRDETEFNDMKEIIVLTRDEGGYPLIYYHTFNLPITSIIAGEFEGESVRCTGHFRYFKVVKEEDKKKTKQITELVIED